MTTQTTTRAILFLGDAAADAIALKRLALFFDEILFIPSEGRLLDTELLHDGEHFIEVEPGHFVAKDFSYFKDLTAIRLPVKSTSSPLKEVLEEFVDKGIARQFEPERSSDVEGAPSFDEVVSFFMSSDAKDSRLLELTGTSEDDFRIISVPPATVIVLRSGDGVERSLLEVKHPPVLAHSRVLTTTLYGASQAGASPVFADTSLRPQLAHKYKLFRKGIEILAERSKGEVPLPTHHMSMGAVAFALSTQVLRSSSLERATPESIVRFRRATEEARRKYVSLDLTELSQLAEENPWSAKVDADVRKFIQKKLSADLGHFDSRTKEIWEKLFGGLVVDAAEIAKYATVGSLAGGVAGQIVPFASPIGLLLAGMLAGAAKESPKLVKRLVHFFLERRKHLRSSVAYVSALRGMK